MIDPAICKDFVNKTYAKELKGKAPAQMGKDPATVLSANNIAQFKRLLLEINSRYQNARPPGAAPFQWCRPSRHRN